MIINGWSASKLPGVEIFLVSLTEVVPFHDDGSRDVATVRWGLTLMAHFLAIQHLNGALLVH